MKGDSSLVYRAARSGDRRLGQLCRSPQDLPKGMQGFAMRLRKLVEFNRALIVENRATLVMSILAIVTLINQLCRCFGIARFTYLFDTFVIGADRGNTLGTSGPGTIQMNSCFHRVRHQIKLDSCNWLPHRPRRFFNTRKKAESGNTSATEKIDDTKPNKADHAFRQFATHQKR